MDYLAVIFGLAGGLALFLYGMILLSEGLQRAAGSRLKKILERLTKNRLRGVGTGAVVTAIIQSSSVTTVTLVGLINAGLMSFEQSVPVIMGANIGTTMTAQLVAFKIGAIALPVIALGFVVYFLKRKTEYGKIGQAILGFGILFLGMNIMSSAVSPLHSEPAALEMLAQFGAAPLLGIFAGLVFTGIIQSSSATSALVIALGAEGLVDLPSAIALILGANIGTCVTAIIASVGASLSSKRAALAHVLFNIMGVLIFLPFIAPFAGLVSATAADLPRQIANAHTVFNIAVTIILLPFLGVFILLVKRILPGSDIRVDSGIKHLDKRLLDTPSLALHLAENESMRMAAMVQEMLADAFEFFRKKDPALGRAVQKKEDVVDMLNRAIERYASGISESQLSRKESRRRTHIIHGINDIERIADHVNNIAEKQSLLINQRQSLSRAEQNELAEMFKCASEIYRKAVNALAKEDAKLAQSVIEMEEEISDLNRRFDANNIKRLEGKKVDIGANMLYRDIKRNLRRIAHHSRNISNLVIYGF